MQVFTRLQRLNLCVSHQATITFLTKIGESHDNEVVEWRNSLAIKLEEEVFILIMYNASYSLKHNIGEPAGC